MLGVVAVGCGIVLGLAAAELAGPLYLRLLAACPLGTHRLTRLFLGAHRALLARAGHHPYLVDCLASLAAAEDLAALSTARARLRWWSGVRLASRTARP